jgi:hypothetical protein
MVLLAEWFSRRQSADELPHNRRTLLFAAFDGEEQGLLGSCYLVTRLGSLPWKIAGMLNLDCIGRAPIDGFCCVNTWPEGLLKRLSDDAGLTYSPMAALPESDFWPFYHIGVPVLMFWDDNLRAIHRVSDTWDMIDARRALRIVRVADRAVQDALTDDQFKAQARPRLGLSLIGETNKVSAVADLSPAADAGISAGDVIQSVAGQAVSNRDEFRQASEAVKDRSSFEVVLLRRKQTLAVTLQPGLDGPSSMPTPATAPADAVEAK